MAATEQQQVLTDTNESHQNIVHTCVVEESFVGAAMNTTYGEYSDVRNSFSA